MTSFPNFILERTATKLRFADALEFNAMLTRHAPLVAVLLASLSPCCGCNKYHTPVTINPADEVEVSLRAVNVGTANISVPKRGELHSVDVMDDPPSIRIQFFLVDGEGAMIFSTVNKTPEWVDRSRTVSTKLHKDVPYWIEAMTEPSGDDRPGAYRLRAYLEGPDRDWEVYWGFSHPVEPDLLTALDYLDTVQFDNLVSPPEK